MNQLTTQEKTSLIKKNLFDYFKFINNLKSVTSFKTEHFSGFASGVRGAFINPLIISDNTNIEAESFLKQINAAIDFVNKNEVKELSLWFDSDSSKTKWSSLLQKKGFVYNDKAAGMYFDQKQPIKEPCVENFAIKRANSDNELRDWAETAMDGFGAGADYVEASYNLFKNDYQGGVISNFIALVEGKPAATAQVFLYDDVAGIYWVATIPEYRGKSISTTLTNKLIDFAYSTGAINIVLHSTPMANSMYQKMGFKEYTRMGHFEYWNK